MTTGDLLLRGNAEKVADACLEFASEQISIFDEVVPNALHGQYVAVRTYVESWRVLLDLLLNVVSEQRPDLVQQDEGRPSLNNVEGIIAPYAVRMLDRRASDAPFSPWLNVFGTGRGISVSLVDHLRESLKGVKPLGARPGGLPPWDLDGGEFDRFAALVAAEIEGRKPVLEQVMSAFDLNLTETAELFRVSRQAVAGWLESGEVPRFRKDKAYTIASIGRLLQKQLRDGAVPVVARRPAPAYKNRSLLRAISEDEHEAALESVRASFDWASLA